MNAPGSAENDTIGQRRNADGTTDLGITGDRALIHITDTHLTLDPEEILGSRHRGFLLSAAFTPATCLTTTSTWIVSGTGDTYDLNALLGDAQERGQRTFPLADYRLFSPGPSRGSGV